MKLLLATVLIVFLITLFTGCYTEIATQSEPTTITTIYGWGYPFYWYKPIMPLHHSFRYYYHYYLHERIVVPNEHYKNRDEQKFKERKFTPKDNKKKDGKKFTSKDNKVIKRKTPISKPRNFENRRTDKNKR